jgi:hypothetical protein
MCDMAKMLADATTDRILGVHMIGPYVSELISEAVVTIEFGTTSEDIARIVHAHPSLSEVVHEAALGGQTPHSYLTPRESLHASSPTHWIAASARLETATAKSRGM